MTNRIFIGIEAEGRLKGVQTVFSQRPCVEAIEVAEKNGIKHIFFGAAGHRLLTPEMDELIKIVPAIPPEIIVTLHVELSHCHLIPTTLLARCHVLLYAPCPLAPYLDGDIEIKLEDRQTAAVYNRPQMIDLTYIYDKDVQK